MFRIVDVYDPQKDPVVSAYLNYWHSDFNHLIRNFLENKTTDSQKKIFERLWVSVRDRRVLVEWLRHFHIPQSADSLSTETLILLGHAYFLCASASERDQAFMYYDLAAQRGSVAAKLGLARFYIDRKEDKKACVILQNIQNQDPTAAYLLSRLQKKGKKELLQRAYSENDLSALNRAGCQEFSLLPWKKADSAKSAESFAKAAQLGDSYGMYNLGLAYYQGVGVRKHLIRAVIYMRLARICNPSLSTFHLKEIIKNNIKDADNACLVYHAMLGLAPKFGKWEQELRDFTMTYAERIHQWMRQDRALGMNDLEVAEGLKMLIGEDVYENLLQPQPHQAAMLLHSEEDHIDLEGGDDSLIKNKSKSADRYMRMK